MVESGLTMVAIFGLIDPLRPGIRDAVEQCRKSGINVRMVTGDNLDTAIAISKEAGIITDADLLSNESGYLCMTGKTFRENVGGIVTKVDPETNTRTDSVGNKRAFREVTKKLKVLARAQPMGSGSDTAKNASDIILTNDDFCSVLTAVKYGRNIYDSVRKFL